MSTELAVWSNVSNPMEAVLKYGEIIAKAKFFGCQTTEQGQALVLMAMGENVPITEMRKKYHIIGGDLSMRADYMRAEFERLGGVLTWIDQGDDGKQAVVRVKYKHHDLEVKYTIENAKAEGLVKDKSRWVKNPGDMLRARVSTKSIRMVCSAVLCGFASEDEIDPDADAIIAEPIAVNPVVAAVREAAGVAKPKSQEVATEILATGEQIARLTELFTALKIDPERQLAAIVKRGARDMASLTEEGAADMIASLESKMAAANEATTGESKMPDAVSLPADAPASQAQIDQVRSLLKSVSQTPGNADIGQRVRSKMESHGLKTVADMTGPEAESLINGLSQKNLEAFFENDLRGNKTAPL